MKRDTQAIVKWMQKNRWRQCDIQRELGLARNTPIWETIHGRKDNRRTLQWFINNGCPAGFLDLPDDMKEAA